MFTEPFMLRALMAALVLGPLCALLGVFVTARRMAFFSDTISHAALAGVALGFWWGFTDPTLPMIVFSLIIAAGMMWLKENTDLLTDTIMALLLSGSVAVGVVVLSLLKGYQNDLHRYLFGSILAVDDRDVRVAALLLALVGGWLFHQLSPMTLITAHEEMAHVCGIPVRRLNYLFVIVLTATVAISIRLMGIILVTALIVIPPAIARNVSQNLRQQIVYSLACGLLSGGVGTVLSFQLNVPTGPAIVLTSIALFVLSLVASRLIQRKPALPQ